MAELSYRLELVVGVPVLFDVPGPGHRSATPAEVELFAEVERLRTDQARLADAVAAAYVERDAARGALLGLVGRMLPLVNHSDRAGCPMAFHRSDGEQCTCGALGVVREARAALAEEATP